MKKIIILCSLFLIVSGIFSQSYRKSEISTWIMSKDVISNVSQTNYVNNSNWSVIPFMPPPPNAVPGLEGFSDYATNGNTLSQIYFNGDTAVVAFIYGDSVEAANLNGGNSVRMSYNVSLNGGVTWISTTRLDLSTSKSRWPEINLVNAPGGRTVVGTGRVWTTENLRAGGACVDLAFGVGVGSVFFVPGTGQSGNTDVVSAIMNDGNLACLMQSADTIYFFKFNVTTNTFTARQPIFVASNMTNVVCSYKIAASRVSNSLTACYVFINEPISGGDPIRSLRVQNSTDGGTTWSTPPTKVLGNAFINGDSCHVYWHEDAVFKTGTSTPYYVFPTYDYTSETNPEITRKAWKIILQSPGLNSGQPVVVADWNNIPVLQDTVSYNLVTRVRTIQGQTRLAFQVNSCILSHPTIGFSSDGNTIYCAFAVTQVDTSAEGFNYFDIWMTKSTNGGLNWATPQNITSSQTQDEMYPVLSRYGNDGDGKVTYHSTSAPGCQGFGVGSVIESLVIARVYQCFNAHPIGIQNISGEVPDKFTLEQNYPNPFNPSTIIKFGISKTSNVTLKIYNITGQEVATLINNEIVTPGIKSIVFNPVNLASGVYFYTLAAGDFRETKKMILVK